MSNKQNFTTIESQVFTKLKLPNLANWRSENRPKMIIFIIKDWCIILRTNTLQKVRKCMFCQSCNLLFIN